MTRKAKVYEVLIASPEDVGEYREVARDTIDSWHKKVTRNDIILLPKLWEIDTRPEAKHPQKSIDRQILAESDIVVAIFWTSLGSEAVDGDTGTVHEVRNAIEADKEVLIYFCDDNYPTNIDADRLGDLRRFKQSISEEIYYKEFSGADDFRQQLHKHLSMTVAEIENDTSPLREKIADYTDRGERLLKSVKQDYTDITKGTDEAMRYLDRIREIIDEIHNDSDLEFTDDQEEYITDIKTRISEAGLKYSEFPSSIDLWAEVAKLSEEMIVLISGLRPQ